VALVTIDAVVHVARYILVMKGRGVVAAVASRALEDGIVARIGVAGGAHAVRISVINRELRELGMVEGGAGPAARVVAGLAGGGEELRLRRVARIRRVVVVGLMASNAGGWQCRVIVVDVAIGALARGHSVQAGQGKCSVVVVEGGIGPEVRVVADLASSREARRSMSGIVRGRVILLMA